MKTRVRLQLHDLRSDLNDVANEYEFPEENGDLLDALRPYLEASDTLIVEVDGGTCRLLTREEAHAAVLLDPELSVGYGDSQEKP